MAALFPWSHLRLALSHLWWVEDSNHMAAWLCNWHSRRNIANGFTVIYLFIYIYLRVCVCIVDIVYDSRAIFRHSHRNLLAWSFKNAQIGERCGRCRYGGNAEKELVEKQGWWMNDQSSDLHQIFTRYPIRWIIECPRYSPDIHQISPANGVQKYSLTFPPLMTDSEFHPMEPMERSWSPGQHPWTWWRGRDHKTNTKYGDGLGGECDLTWLSEIIIKLASIGRTINEPV